MFVHVLPQLIPAGEDDTAPEPVPDLITVNAGCVRVKLALQTESAARTTVVFAAVPVQAPDHPTKIDPTCAAATRLTIVAAE